MMLSPRRKIGYVASVRRLGQRLSFRRLLPGGTSHQITDHSDTHRDGVLYTQRRRPNASEDEATAIHTSRDEEGHAIDRYAAQSKSRALLRSVVVPDEDASVRTATSSEKPRRRRRQLTGGGTDLSRDGPRRRRQPLDVPPRRRPSGDRSRRPPGVRARYVDPPADRIRLKASKNLPRAVDGAELCCSKCDGAHADEACPWFAKERDKHPDAKRGKPKHLGGDSAPIFLRGARVVPQPPDGSCLFHSLAYGLQDGRSALALRIDIASFIRRNPDLEIADTPLKDWIKWEALVSVNTYTSKMEFTGWGGAVEMAAAAELNHVNIEVYEPSSLGYRRISLFAKAGAKQTIRVLYRGGVHYDALVV